MTQLSGTLDNGIQPAPAFPAADRDDVSGPPGFHLEALLSPGRMFSHPTEVVGHPGLTRMRSALSWRPGHRTRVRSRLRQRCAGCPVRLNPCGWMMC